MEGDVVVPPDKNLIDRDNTEMSGTDMDLLDLALDDDKNFNLATGKLIR